MFLEGRMKATHTCMTCLMEFPQKSAYERHKNRKRPCKSSGVVKELLEKNPVVEPTGSFRQNSVEMNKKLKKDIRKAQGIFFTPKQARDLLFDTLSSLHVNPTRILEPSFGSGEFLYDALSKYPSAQITGVELNQDLYKSVDKKTMTLINDDFLKFTSNTQYDLILGNPPYFLIKEKWKECMVGRPNIYVAFLYKSLKEHLAENGFLAFVLPTSLFNCSYYEPMRKYIKENCTIHLVQELDVKYYQTEQDTMLLVVQKTVDPTHKYIFERSGNTYISPQAEDLNELVRGTKTLDELGFDVKTGEVVWNQEKEKLTDTPGTLLLYNSNIINCKLELNGIHDKKNEKKQYIKDFHKTPITQPAILVNRGYGNVFAFNFVYVENLRFYAENHINMILARTPEARALFPKIIKSFEDPYTKIFVSWFVGNGALSATELQKVLPLFLN